MLQLGRDKSHILNYEAQSHMEVFEFLKFLVCNLKRNHLTVQQLREWNGLVITPDDLCFLNFITVLIYVFLVCISRICCIWALIEINFFKFKKKTRTYRFYAQVWRQNEYLKPFQHPEEANNFNKIHCSTLRFLQIKINSINSITNNPLGQHINWQPSKCSCTHNIVLHSEVNKFNCKEFLVSSTLMGNLFKHSTINCMKIAVFRTTSISTS